MEYRLVNEEGQVLMRIDNFYRDEDEGYALYDSRVRPNTFLGVYETWNQAQQAGKKVAEAKGA